mgnify:CR=1 FL=1|jgi:hypothetical protein
MNVVDTRHGYPYDRGMADSYYRRPYNPHYYKDGTYNGQPVECRDMSAAEIVAYTKGFEENEAAGNHKEW